MAALAVSALTFSSCGGQQQGGPRREEGPRAYKTMTVARQDGTITSRYSASIRGKQYVDVVPQVSGTITQILINDGDQIKKGQSLVVIDQVPYRAALDVANANVKSAEAAVATAKLNAESSVDLLKAEVISENEHKINLNTLASAEAALAQAQAQAQSAQNDLSYTVVKSPVDGSASMVNYHVGTYVSPSISTPLVSVADNNQMYVYFSMSETHTLSLLRASGSNQALMDNMSNIVLILNDGQEYEHIGKVDAISGTIDQTTGSVNFRAVFDNPDLILRDGGNGRAIVKEAVENAIVIPKVATYEIQNKRFAYKVVDGIAVTTEVTVLADNNELEYIISSGLETGDVIIAEGAGLVRAGAQVASN